MEVIEIRVGQCATAEISCEAKAEHDPDDAADRAQRDRLDQKLEEDVAAMRADGQADADLARPLRHAHEHDVHDADAADDERDAGDRAEQHGHDARGGGRGFGDLLLVADGEIVVAAGANVVALAEQLGDLLLRRGEVVGDATCTLIPRKVVPPHDAFHRARVGHDDDVVLVGPLRARALLA